MTAARGGRASRRFAIDVRPTAAAACRAVADEIETLIRGRGRDLRAAPAAGALSAARVVLGLPTGRTPLPVYRELVARHRERGLSFRHVVTFNLDEYWPLPCGDARGFAAFMQRQLFAHVDLDPARVHLPDAAVPAERLVFEAAAYEREVSAAGGFDLVLLGLGRNGHIAFNEPGSPRDSRARLVTLAPGSRRDAGAGRPGHALTLGVHSIRLARRVRLLATGAGKAAIVARVLNGPPTRELPASLLRGHPDLRVILDAAAARLL